MWETIRKYCKGKNIAAFAALAPASDVQALASIEAQDVARTPTGQAELDIEDRKSVV